MGRGGLDEDTLSTLLSYTKRALGLETYFTAGELECRVVTAPQVAGVIHTDFEKGFICGEVVRYADLDRLGGGTRSARTRGWWCRSGRST